MPPSLLNQADPEIMALLGRRLRAARKSQHLTVEEVAERTDLNPSTVARAERGQNPTLLTLLRLLRVYGLLEGIDSIAPEPQLSPIEEARRRRQRGGQ